MAKRNCTIDAAVVALAGHRLVSAQQGMVLCGCGSWFRNPDAFSDHQGEAIRDELAAYKTYTSHRRSVPADRHRLHRRPRPAGEVPQRCRRAGLLDAVRDLLRAPSTRRIPRRPHRARRELNNGRGVAGETISSYPIPRLRLRNTPKGLWPRWIRPPNIRSSPWHTAAAPPHGGPGPRRPRRRSAAGIAPRTVYRRPS